MGSSSFADDTAVMRGKVVALTKLIVSAVLLSMLAGSAAPQPRLRDLGAARGVLIGFAANARLLAGDPAYRQLAAREFSQITPELAMKWDATQPAPGRYTFAAADQIMEFADTGNQLVHGHTLVWHYQTPGWVQELDAAGMRSALAEHIGTVAGRYAHHPRLQSWDVVNEAFADDGRLRNSFWLQRLGPDYIADAFRFARAADPDARLCLNDYGIEGINAKSTALYDYVRTARERAVPIDCVGFQGHLSVQDDLPPDITENLQRFAALGVQVRISELDVRIPVPAGPEALEQQRHYYAAVVRACLAVPACTGVTMWGLTDRHSWVPANFPGEGHALLFDDGYRPKGAYSAVRGELEAFCCAMGGGLRLRSR